ncbi:MAG: hypothetical protein AAF242_18865 [Bacteroidota bacterium]
MKVDRSDIIAVFALLISFLTFGIGLYEARIMAKEQQLIKSQQKASVWPYLEIERKFSVGDVNDLRIYVVNKGVGPAIINFVEKRSNSILDSLSGMELLDLVISSMDTTVEQENERNVLPSYDLKPVVLSPNEKHDLFKYRGPNLRGEEDFIRKMMGTTFRYCYSNIYGDTWVKEFGQLYPQPAKDCPIEKKEEAGTIIMPFSTN